MLFTVASEGWAPGLPLTPAETRVGLFRTRDAAGRVAAGRPTLAVCLRYHPDRGTVTAQPPADRAGTRGWAVQAIEDASGGVTVLGTIPGSLIRLVGPARIRIHAGQDGPSGPFIIRRFHGVGTSGRSQVRRT